MLVLNQDNIPMQGDDSIPSLNLSTRQHIDISRRNEVLICATVHKIEMTNEAQKATEKLKQNHWQVHVSSLLM